MDVLSSIRQERTFSAAQYQKAGGTGKSKDVSQSRMQGQSPARIAETLERLFHRLNQASDCIQESRRTLQTGESALAEVQDSLSRMADLARQAAGGDPAGRVVLQEELERLRGEIDRVLEQAVAGDTPLFQDAEDEVFLINTMNEVEVLLRSVLEEGQSQAVPDWLLQGAVLGPVSESELLAALGLDASATAKELMAVLQNTPLGANTAVDYLASLYLGAVIAGGAAEADTAACMEGLRQLLAEIAGGVPIDQAIRELTSGLFEGLEDFQAQFSGGDALDLIAFLSDLLLTDGNGNALPMLELSFVLDFLSGLEGVNLDLLMDALTSSLSTGAAGYAEAAESGTMTGMASGGLPNIAPMQTQSFGAVQVAGTDLSGVIYDKNTGTLIIRGEGDVTVTAHPGSPADPPPSVRIAGSGMVTLRDAAVTVLRVESPMARIAVQGRVPVASMELEEGASLTLEGGGFVKIGRWQGSRTSAVWIAGSAVEVEQDGALPVYVDGVASFVSPTPRTAPVRDVRGATLEAFDIVWKTMLPGWNQITGIAVDGRQTEMSLYNRGSLQELARLWLDKGADPSHGHPVHTVTVYGRDEEEEQVRTRYAYLRWDDRTGTFQEILMYPNPFTVTGGEEGEDWTYDQAAQTLRILTDQVAGLSGGSGMDAEDVPFSGRIVLEDHIGMVMLVLNGVDCRVPAGKAFDLGRENHVTLLLQGGKSNIFASGAGYAGISLGDGSSLDINAAAANPDTAPDDLPSPGTLTAAGSNGGAGIGRDSGGSWDRTSQITIHGGVIAASGGGGGAGIGAGAHGFMGALAIYGGVITALGGERGGAGIGGALGAPVGDITIRGGVISAEAVYHAAGIGAGVRGECGDILITGNARIQKAKGGDSGADIGACIFGGCGAIQVTNGADIGGAQIKQAAPSEGISLPMGNGTMTLPRFFLSSHMLLPGRLSLATRDEAQAAASSIRKAGFKVSRIQAAYHALCSRLDRNIDSLRSAHEYVGAAHGLIRDSGAAGVLLTDTKRTLLRQSSQAMRTHVETGAEDVLRLLR